ncbi:hypothetical protein SUGI_1124100 [Cryptomeria japonica]|nr:hypothetical protein SUGI_1124100 [Cryptomeria japonica]
MPAVKQGSWPAVGGLHSPAVGRLRKKSPSFYLCSKVKKIIGIESEGLELEWRLPAWNYRKNYVQRHPLLEIREIGGNSREGLDRRTRFGPSSVIGRIDFVKL